MADMYDLRIRRPITLLAGCILTTIAVFMLCILVLYAQAVAEGLMSAPPQMLGLLTAGSETIGIPQCALAALACALMWVGYCMHARGITFVAGVLLCVAMVLRFVSFLILPLPILLAFVGYASQGKARAAAEAEAEERRAREFADRELGRMLDALSAGKSLVEAMRPAELPPIPERKADEDEGDRLGRLSVQAQRWNDRQMRMR